MVANVPDFLSPPREFNGSEDRHEFSNPLLWPLDGSHVVESLLNFQELSAYLCNDASRGFVGKLFGMCSAKEFSQKIQMNTANDLERDSENKVNVLLCLKSFQRSDASRTFKPEDVRPAIWCRRTVYNILCHFADADLRSKDYLLKKQFAYLDIYNFLRDRLRSIWQDLTVQHCCKTRAYIECFEISIRFLIYSNEILFDNDEYDIAQNLGLLNTCLDKLMDGYLDVHAAKTRSVQCNISSGIGNGHRSLVLDALLYSSPYEAEFWSYRLLILTPHLLVPGASIFCDVLKKIPQQLKNTSVVQFAIKVCLAASSGNFFQYFSMMHNPVAALQSAVMNRFSSCIRIKFMDALVHGNMVSLSRNPISMETFNELLGFNPQDEVAIRCFYTKYGLGLKETSTVSNALDLDGIDAETLAKDVHTLQKAANKIKSPNTLVRNMLQALPSRQTIFDPDFKYPSWFNQDVFPLQSRWSVQEAPSSTSPKYKFDFLLNVEKQKISSSDTAKLEDRTKSGGLFSQGLAAPSSAVGSATSALQLGTSPATSPPVQVGNGVVKQERFGLSAPLQQIGNANHTAAQVQTQPLATPGATCALPNEFKQLEEYINNFKREQEKDLISLEQLLKMQQKKLDNTRVILHKPAIAKALRTEDLKLRDAPTPNELEKFTFEMLYLAVDYENLSHARYKMFDGAAKIVVNACNVSNVIEGSSLDGYSAATPKSRHYTRSVTASSVDGKCGIKYLSCSGSCRMLDEWYRDLLRIDTGGLLSQGKSKSLVSLAFSCKYCQTNSGRGFVYHTFGRLKRMFSEFETVVSTSATSDDSGASGSGKRARVTSDETLDSAEKRIKLRVTQTLRSDAVYSNVKVGASVARSLLGFFFKGARRVLSSLGNKCNSWFTLNRTPLHSLMDIATDEAQNILDYTNDFILQNSKLDSMHPPSLWAGGICWHLYLFEQPSDHRGVYFNNSSSDGIVDAYPGFSADFSLQIRMDVLAMLGIKTSIDELRKGSAGYKRAMAEYCSKNVWVVSQKQSTGIPAVVYVSLLTGHEPGEEPLSLEKSIATPVEHEIEGIDTGFNLDELRNNIKNVDVTDSRYFNAPNIVVYTCSNAIYLGNDTFVYDCMRSSDGNLKIEKLSKDAKLSTVDAFNILRSLYGNFELGTSSPLVRNSTSRDYSQKVYIVCYRIALSKLDLLCLYEAFYLVHTQLKCASGPLTRFEDVGTSATACNCRWRSRVHVQRILEDIIESFEKGLRQSLVDRAAGYNQDNVQRDVDCKIVLCCVGFQLYHAFDDFDYLETAKGQIYIPRILFRQSFYSAIEKAGMLLIAARGLHILQKPFEMPHIGNAIMDILSKSGRGNAKANGGIQGSMRPCLRFLTDLIRNVTLNMPKDAWDCACNVHLNAIPQGCAENADSVIHMPRGRYSKQALISSLVELKRGLERIEHIHGTLSSLHGKKSGAVGMVISELFKSTLQGIWVPYAVGVYISSLL